MRFLHIAPINIHTETLRLAGPTIDGPPGLKGDGPSRSVIGLAHGLRELGHEVALLTTRPIDQSTGSHFSGIRLFNTRKRVPDNPWRNADHWIQRIEQQFGIPDVVNFHGVYDFWQCALATSCLKKGWPYVVTPRGGLRPMPQARSPIKKRVVNWLVFNSYLKHATALLALSQEEAQDIRHFLPAIEKIRIVSNGIFPSTVEWAESRTSSFADRNPTGKPIRVGFVGQYDVDIKGLDLLFEAIYKLKECNLLHNFCFEFHGRFKKRNKKKARWHRRVIKDYERKIARPDQFQIHPAIFGMKKWHTMMSFDVFALTSRTEGMPVAVLEALAVGKPCLTTSGTTMNPYIIEGDAGWACETNDNAIFRALKEISCTPRETILERGRNGQSLIKRRFLWKAVAKRYADQISGVLA